MRVSRCMAAPGQAITAQPHGLRASCVNTVKIVVCAVSDAAAASNASSEKSVTRISSSARSCICSVIMIARSLIATDKRENYAVTGLGVPATCATRAARGAIK